MSKSEKDPPILKSAHTLLATHLYCVSPLPGGFQCRAQLAFSLLELCHAFPVTFLPIIY